jgi:hypothetical protein
MAKEICPECGVQFQPEHPLATFCCKAHKRAYFNRNTAQGGPLIPMLKAWRKARHLPKGDPLGGILYTEICLELDKMIAADFAAGRPNPAEVYKARMRRQGLGARLKFKAPKKVVKVKEEKEAA